MLALSAVLEARSVYSGLQSQLSVVRPKRAGRLDDTGPHAGRILRYDGNITAGGTKHCGGMDGKSVRGHQSVRRYHTRHDRVLSGSNNCGNLRRAAGQGTKVHSKWRQSATSFWPRQMRGVQIREVLQMRP